MKSLILILIISASQIFAQQNDFIKKAQSENAAILQDGDTKAWCSVCGMNLKMFYKTNHAIEFKDGSNKQYCSIHCFCSEEPKQKDKINNIFVVDAKTEKMINAKDAYYVVGSDAKGTMSPISKIAFESKSNAEEFMTKFNGKSILQFDEVKELVASQLDNENKMLMKKKEMKVFPKGKKLFSKLCNKKIDLDNFLNIAELKAHIKNNNFCKNIDEKKLQMIALYLWNTKGKEKSHKAELQNITVPETAKCPVCGMFVYKYPKWTAVIKTDDSELYFDGVKDLMKFYFDPKEWGEYEHIKFNEIIVNDYYLQKPIDGKSSVYVIESDVYGPMGNELIPFSNKKSAMDFINDHGGKLIHNFNDITKNIVKKLDE